MDYARERYSHASGFYLGLTAGFLLGAGMMYAAYLMFA